MKKARRALGAFASEAEERAYWEREDSTPALDWRRAARVRLPNSAQHDRDLAQGSQSLIKMWLAEKVG